MSELKKMQEDIVSFRDERDWKKFHNPKDLFMATIVEMGELGEHLLWDRVNPEYLEVHKEDIEDEYADVMNLLLLLAKELDIDIPASCERKLKKARLKYPVEKSKGRSTKHTEL